ncbi:MAG: hypothetical protein IPL89_06970 [Acidobacteria bacterium]|nr:hypothetical protein [Acidobacteriota bacterium]
MSKKLFATIGLSALLLVAAAPAAVADDLTGSNRFLCSVVTISRCYIDGCMDDTPDGALVPQFVNVDLGAKLISTTPASGQNRTTPIESLRREGGLIVLQGLENGRAFSFVIAEKTGSASVAIAREDLVLAVSAMCTPMPAAQK